MSAESKDQIIVDICTSNTLIEAGIIHVLGDTAVIVEKMNEDVDVFITTEPLNAETLEIIKQLTESGTPVVIYSSNPSPEGLIDAITKGRASAYITPDEEPLLGLSHPDTIARIIHTVAEGGVHYPSSLVPAAMETLKGNKVPNELTPREEEVLHLVNLGINNQRIAHELGIAEQTVKTHLGSIYTKFGVSNRHEAVLFATKKGMLEDEVIFESSSESN